MFPSLANMKRLVRDKHPPLASFAAMKQEKSVTTLTPGASTIKLFTAVIVAVS